MQVTARQLMLLCRHIRDGQVALGPACFYCAVGCLASTVAGKSGLWATRSSSLRLKQSTTSSARAVFEQEGVQFGVFVEDGKWW